MALITSTFGNSQPGLSGINSSEALQANLAASCVPISIIDMEADGYNDFLDERRQLMAFKIRDYYWGL